MILFYDKKWPPIFSRASVYPNPKFRR